MALGVWSIGRISLLLGSGTRVLAALANGFEGILRPAGDVNRQYVLCNTVKSQSLRSKGHRSYQIIKSKTMILSTWLAGSCVNARVDKPAKKSRARAKVEGTPVTSVLQEQWRGQVQAHVVKITIRARPLRRYTGQELPGRYRSQLEVEHWTTKGQGSFAWSMEV